MKLKFMAAVASLGILFSCSEPYRATDQSLGVAVPETTRVTFNSQYPTASNVVWSQYDQVVVPIDWELSGWEPMDASDYVVQFDMDNQKYYAWYDADGYWVGTAYVVTDHNTLPLAVTNTLNAELPGYSIKSINRELHKDKMAYEIELENSNGKAKLLVDDQGNILKKKTKTD